MKERKRAKEMESLYFSLLLLLRHKDATQGEYSREETCTVDIIVIIKLAELEAVSLAADIWGVGVGAQIVKASETLLIRIVR